MCWRCLIYPKTAVREVDCMACVVQGAKKDRIRGEEHLAIVEEFCLAVKEWCAPLSLSGGFLESPREDNPTYD